MSSYGYSSNNSRYFDSSASSSTSHRYSTQTIPTSGYPPVDQTSSLEHNDGQIPVYYGPPSQPYLVTDPYSYVATNPVHHPDQLRSSTSPTAPATWPVSLQFASAVSPSTPFNRSPVAPSSAPSSSSPEAPIQLSLGASHQQFYSQHYPETEATSSPNQFRMPPDGVYGDLIYPTAPHSRATAANLTESLGGPNITSHGDPGSAYVYMPAPDQPGVWSAPSQDNPSQMSGDDSLFQQRGQTPSHTFRHTLPASGGSSLDYTSYPPTPNPLIPPAPSPFRAFPGPDTQRDLTYQYPYSDQANAQLPNSQVHDVPRAEDPLHQSLVPAMRSTLPSTLRVDEPTTATEEDTEQQEGPSVPPARQYFLESARQSLALWLLQQDWLKENQEESPVSSVETVAVRNLLAAAMSSCRFDLLFEREGRKGKFRCLWLDGEPCNHISERQERARGHARYHFDYRPYPCHGDCGKQGCQGRYTCQSSRSDHVGRKKKPKRPCSVCNDEFSAQNLRRHMKVHEQSRHEQPESSSPDTRPSKQRRR